MCNIVAIWFTSMCYAVFNYTCLNKMSKLRRNNKLDTKHIFLQTHPPTTFSHLRVSTMANKSLISSPVSKAMIAIPILILVFCFTSSDIPLKGNAARGNKVIYPDIPPVFPVRERRETHTRCKIIEYKNMSDYLPAARGYDNETNRNRRGDFHKIFACNEQPPVCAFTGRIHFEIGAKDLEYAENGGLHVVNLNLVVYNARGVCQIDPLPKGIMLYQQNVPFKIIVIIQCRSPEVRVVFQPSRNLTNTTAFATLMVNNCIMYWKDLSTFGLHMNFLNFKSSGWRNEFVNGEPGYYHYCIQNHTNTISAQNGYKSMLPNIIYSPIPGLHNLVSIDSSGTPSTVDVAFTTHLWPSLASFTL